MRACVQRSIIAPAVPFAAILLGLYLLHNAWAAMLLYHLGMVLILALNRQANRLGAVRSGWNPGAAAIACVMCAASGLLFLLLWRTVSLDHMGLRTSLGDLGLSGTSWWVFSAYYVTVHPLLEEVFWRGYLASGSRGPTWPDFAFAGYHVLVLVFFIKFPWTLVAFVVLFTAAWSWRLLAMKRRGLAVPILSHVVADLSIVLAAEHLARSGGL